MNNLVKFEQGALKLQFSTIRTVLSFRNEFVIPIKDIIKVRRYPITSEYRGLRWPGIYVPFLITAGTFFKSNSRNFWNVMDETRAIEISLRNNLYQKIILDVDDPEKTIHEINNKLDMIKSASFSSPQFVTSSNSYPVIEREVVLYAKERPFNATFTYPQKPGQRFPAILLTQGSGPTDRNWNSPQLRGNNGSGRLIAQELARMGCSSIRYDKCGSAGTPLPKPLNWDDYINEQKSSIDFLVSQEIVDPDSVFAAGHSEGALHTLRLASTDYRSHLKGLLLLAPPGRSLRNILVSQISKQLQAAKISDEIVESEITKLNKGLESIIRKSPQPDIESTMPGIKALYQSFFKPEIIHFSQEILGFSPTDALSQLDIPTLIVCGDKDIQTDSQLDARALQTSNHCSSLVVLPNSNHVFKYEGLDREQLSTQDALRYNTEESTLDLQLCHTIGAWVNDQLQLNAGHTISVEEDSNEISSLIRGPKGSRSS